MVSETRIVQTCIVLACTGMITLAGLEYFFTPSRVSIAHAQTLPLQTPTEIS